MKLKFKTNKGAKKKSTLSSFTEPLEELPLQFDQVSDEGEEDLDPTGFNQAVTWATDWTTETIVPQLQRGIIDLDPNFQRRDAWRLKRKSEFIESLILGLPIPQIVLAERKEKKGSFFVIDGKQRLLTLQQFCKTPKQGGGEGFKLSDLLVEKTLNERSYLDLLNDPELSEKLAAFNTQTIRTVVIKNWPNEDFLYTVFLRLNSNSVQLSPQELRKALHPGPFLSFIDNAAGQSKELLGALNLKEPDFRMRDVEIALRHYAFRNFIREYKGNLKQFLDITCKTLNKQWGQHEKNIRQQFVDLESAISITESIFGKKHAFRKFSNGEYETRLNRAVFDICLFYFSTDVYREKMKGKESKIKRAFEILCTKDVDFLRALETSTKITDVVKKRFETWGHLLSKTVGVPFKSPFAA